VQVLHPHQKSEVCRFVMVEDARLKGVEVTFNGMIFLLNFMKIYQLVQKSLMGDGQAEW
jgi:hypothetical protein